MFMMTKNGLCIVLIINALRKGVIRAAQKYPPCRPKDTSGRPKRYLRTVQRIALRGPEIMRWILS